MAPSKPKPDTSGVGPAPGRGPEQTARPKTRKKRKHISMHEGIGVWADCCSCEAEPRWAALAEEMGIDLSDYEDDEYEDESE